MVFDFLALVFMLNFCSMAVRKPNPSFVDTAVNNPGLTGVGGRDCSFLEFRGLVCICETRLNCSQHPSTIARN